MLTIKRPARRQVVINSSTATAILLLTHSAEVLLLPVDTQNSYAEAITGRDALSYVCRQYRLQDADFACFPLTLADL